jgi:hypothetical protein
VGAKGKSLFLLPQKGKSQKSNLRLQMFWTGACDLVLEILEKFLLSSPDSYRDG